MLRSLWSGVTGLKTHQLEMDVIGNNIANVNTTAYKSQATGFNDILYQTVKEGSVAGQTKGSTNASQVGLGAKVSSIYTNISTQGSAITTNDAFDLMITGPSFFLIGNESNGAVNQIDATTRSYKVNRVSNGYSRDGSFEIDSWGYLVTKNAGYYVLGAEGNEDIPATKEGTKPIQVMNVVEEYNVRENKWEKRVSDTIAGEATTAAYLKGNIDREDDSLEEGQTVMLDVFGADGNTYTLKFKITDAGDDSDNTYKARIDTILDKDGKAIENTSAEKEVTLIYSLSDGTLENIVSGQDYSFYSTGQEMDGQGRVTATNFAYESTVRYLEEKATVTGTDGESYQINFSMKRIDSVDDNNDYVFSVDSVTKLSGDGSGKTYAISDLNAKLDFDVASGNLVTVNGEARTSFSFSFAETDLPIGNLNFDFSKARKLSDDDGSFTFEFDGEAEEKLGEILNVDFEHITNYANSIGGHKSAIFAYKGTENGLLKGYPRGELNGISFGTDGSIYASYSNGQTIKKGQIAVAEFANATGLEKIGENLYMDSLNTGVAVVQDITKNGGYMNSGVLEGSNVDLAKEFTDMITTQRGFQANSKVITTSDEMLQLLRDLKR